MSGLPFPLCIFIFSAGGFRITVAKFFFVSVKGCHIPPTLATSEERLLAQLCITPPTSIAAARNRSAVEDSDFFFRSNLQMLTGT